MHGKEYYIAFEHWLLSTLGLFCCALVSGLPHLHAIYFHNGHIFLSETFSLGFIKFMTYTLGFQLLTFSFDVD